MPNKSSVLIVAILSLLFISASTFCLLHEMFLIYCIPILICFIILAFISLDKFLFLIAFLTPLSITLTDIGLGIGMNLPTEPLLFGILILFSIKYLHKGDCNIKVLKHPFSLIILLYLSWMLICSVASQDVLVSFKYFISKLWYIIPFYFFGSVLFKDVKNIKKFYLYFIFGLLLVVCYTLVRHSFYGFDQHSSGWVMTPFFRDHTSYGATIAMLLFPLIGFIYSSSGKTRGMLFLALFLIISGFIFSYTRAAWLSFVIALGLGLVMYFRINIKWLFTMFTFFLGLFIIYQDIIFVSLEKNNQDSSDNFIEHVKSISNISTDASNLERINRWKSAIRMFKERPIFGWGPGAYQFYYASYQHPSEKTIISTNAADRGNAHSEYIGALAETGVLGGFLFIALMLSVITRGVNIYYSIYDKEIKIIVITTLLGLTTYFTHAAFNNFLDMDKISVPFWAMISMLMAIDLNNREQIT